MRKIYLVRLVFALDVFVIGIFGVHGQSRCASHNELLRVVDTSGSTGYIDRTGTVKLGPADLPAKSVVFRDFSEGLAAVAINLNWDNGERGFEYGHSYMGFIDASGKFMIAPRFQYAGDFCNGLAYVTDGQTNEYIDRTGKVVFIPDRDCYHGGPPKMYAHLCTPSPVASGPVGHVSEGLYAFATAPWARDAKYGFADLKGKIVIKPQFEPDHENHGFVRLETRFVNGYAAVKLGGKFGMINRRGKFVVEPKYQFVGELHEGLAFVQVSQTESGYVDKKARMVIKNDGWQSGGPFSEGLAPAFAVQPPGVYQSKTGYIDRSGKFVIAPRFEGADAFHEGIARIYEAKDANQWESNYGYIDRKGKYIWRPGTASITK